MPRAGGFPADSCRNGSSAFVSDDLDVVLPRRRLTELTQEGIAGQPASGHYSLMGYIP
jgi:hypothetical protein